MAEYRQDYRGVGEMLNAPWMEAAMRQLIEPAKPVAEGLAPVGKLSDGDQTPGSYKADFHIESGRCGGVHHDRAYGRLVNNDPNAFMVEFGNRNIRKHRVLGKALGAVRP